MKYFLIAAILLRTSLVLGGDASSGCPAYVLDWGQDLSPYLSTLKFLPVDPGVLVHPIEKRGFVSVPIDYSWSQSPKINIFYRIIPAKGGSVEDRTKPLVVVINGGPGLPSSIYRAMDYDYSTAPEDRLSHLTERFRVMLIDQRGTAGASAPLDLTDPLLRPEIIAKYFNGDEHALDMGVVIREVVKADDSFLILGQSYGGHVGFQYLRFSNILPAPRGYVFSSIPFPGISAVEKSLARRAEQLRLQQQLLKNVPGMDLKLNGLRAHFVAEGLDASLVHQFWKMVGWGVGWEEKLVEEVERLMKLGRADLEAEVAKKNDGVHLLNYVLSSAVLSPGYTDNTLSLFAQQQIPFEPWMLDECETLRITGSGWPNTAVAAMDANPPPPADLGDISRIVSAIGRTQVLYTFGEGDAQVPLRYSLPASERFRVRGHTFSVLLPGGHPAIWGVEGVDAIERWMRTIP